MVHDPVTPPALAVLEVASIARGLTVADGLVKRAAVRILVADPVTPGKYLLVFTGGEEEVLEAMEAGQALAGADAIDSLVLPGVHRALPQALGGLEAPPIDGALGTLEMKTAAATLLAADAALKVADVTLVALHLCRGIDGKGYVVFTGAQDAVEAALEAGDDAVEPSQRAGNELIARPHPDVHWALGRLRLD
jgi:microcompartment protein CcmL/EutN